ncbi:AI-2E family transporter [Natrarchaeobaculum aegyptiacum]|uniref:AI-2E family transporter n=1 Tax=Natrarchaeobaculum aegyptiacum TaxID=745377 RepID=A0A2Z2HRF6_9EURY|nr:AI-2E family transporter [Natrarchaeobaculum aegyptiacum]ARS88625.1 AI-2E family transporter [Natrarchaeobaculum aegyptiacum]
MDVRTGFLALVLAITGAIVFLLVAPLLQYVLAAGLLAFVCYPIHRRLRARVDERLSALAVTGLAIVTAVFPILILSVFLVGSVIEFLDSLEELTILETIRETALEFGVEEAILDELEAELLAEFEPSLGGIVEVALAEAIGLLNASVRLGFGLLVLVFVLYYLLVDGRAFVDWVGSVAPLSPGVREELFDEIETVTWAVIYSHVLVAVVEGVLGGLGFYLLGVPNVAFWTVVMMLVSFLPAIGIWLVWGPGVVYLALTAGPLPALVLLLYGVAVLSVVDNYLRAIFVDRGSGVHPAIVLVGVIGGIYLFGVVGLFLGPVLLAAFKAGLTVFAGVNGLDAFDDLESDSTDADESVDSAGQTPDVDG